MSSSSFSGLVLMPDRVVELCITVLLQAVNHPKRSDKSNLPIGPPSVFPSQISFQAFKYSFKISYSISGVKAHLH